MNKSNQIVLIFLFLLSFSLYSGAQEFDRKAVLVTGASSGIGLRITELLAAEGHVVYAGARKKEDLARLEAMDNVESVRLDVTVQSDIDAAVKLVESKGRGLHGIVNNAGVVVMGPLIEVPLAELEWQFDVNVYGPYRVTQAFAPLIIASKGRIVSTGSITGIFSSSMGGHYGMSKHAVEAFTDSLAQEMLKFGVQVSVIEPGTYASKSGKSAAQRLEKLAYWSSDSAYSDELKFLKLVMSQEVKGNDPIAVAQAVSHALFSAKPKRRYLVVADSQTADLTLRKAMERVVQLNHDQPFTKSRDQLVKILDEQLKALK